MITQNTSIIGAAKNVKVTDKRIIAAIVDLFLFIVASGIVAAILGGSGQDAITGFTMLVLAFLYYGVFQGRSGQTLGKKWLGIRVIREDTGGVPGAGRGVIRTVVGVVDAQFFFLVGLIAIWASQKNRRLGDMLANTLVVRDQPQQSARGTSGTSAYGQLASVRGTVDLTSEEALDEAQAFVETLGYTTLQRTGNSLTASRRSASDAAHNSPTLTVATVTQPDGGVRITVRGNDRDGVQEHQAEWLEWSESLSKKAGARTETGSGSDDAQPAKREALEDKETTEANRSSTPNKGELDDYEKLRRLAELRDDGHITSEEFQAKKRELLDRM